MFKAAFIIDRISRHFDGCGSVLGLLSVEAPTPLGRNLHMQQEPPGNRAGSVI